MFYIYHVSFYRAWFILEGMPIVSTLNFESTLHKQGGLLL